ncbi:Acyltransferase family protein [Marinomonas aquimarina]|uniref:Acyltransferase family protein n=1 Tax=Marinomonas aquimarina TaxID=295068 RepID=A0A1A8T1J6_9GAMM|nr:acyltransferase [Marinomonas aquimarina]SBS25821.1 Acyltransferase family protein [Marinomonas aquimarina]
MAEKRLHQRYVGEFTDSTNNNFNLIRLLCAWGVLVFHSVPLAEQTYALSDPLLHYLGVSMGEFCVMVFFAISGFLIYRSMCRSSSLNSYIIARALRLLPALLVVLVLTAFIVGPLATELSLGQYFSHPETWSYLNNVNLLTNRTQYTLPGVFSDNPYPNAVNGSLWTLPLETRMYVVTIAFFYSAWLLTRLFKEKMRWLSPLLLAAILIWAYWLLDGYSVSGERHELFKNLFFLAFFIGGVIYAYRDSIPLKASWALVLILGVEFLRTTSIYPIYGTFTIVYTVLVLAYLPKGKILAFNKLGDYSYGMYIYAFPVQQCLSHWTDIGFFGMVLWATVITLALSVISWHLLESPILGQKKKLTNLLKKRRNIAPAGGLSQPD